MALVPLYGLREPIGMFDLKDNTVINGGEVVYLSPVAWNQPSVDEAAADVTEDGYTGTTVKTRPAVTLATASTNHPLFLSDEGTSNTFSTYGTLFGQVVGGIAGQQTVGGPVLGPATYVGSGKCTVWRQPGLYGITLDVLSSDPTNGVQPTNASCTVGAPLSFDANSHLVLQAGGVSGTPVVGYFEEFLTNMSLVNTPVDLVSALNSPSGSVQSASAKKFVMASVYWTGV